MGIDVFWACFVMLVFGVLVDFGVLFLFSVCWVLVFAFVRFRI